MSGVRAAILRSLFNSEGNFVCTTPAQSDIDTSASDSALTDANPNPGETSLHTRASERADELRGIAERLDILCASSFNVATLQFTPGTQGQFSNEAPPVSNSESFLATLQPTTISTRLFLFKIRSLQALLVDLETLRLANISDNNFVSECDNLQGCIHTDLHRLILAAWEAGQQKDHLQTDFESRGVSRFDYSEWLYGLLAVGLIVHRTTTARPLPTGYHLTPLATASVILIAIAHCFLGVARQSCNFILRYVRALLLLAYEMQETRSLTYLIANVDKIPLTLETSLRFLNLQADLDFYVSCPRCSTLYAEGSSNVPNRCGASNIDGDSCHTPLFQDQTRGDRAWRRPERRYSHQRLEVWLSRLLNRPGIEDLLESTKPSPQDVMTDFWEAPYLNNLILGEPGFFNASVPNLRLAFMVYHDFFNPFSNKMAGKQRSVGVVLMVCLNLPAEIRYNRENVYATSVIPGPSEPSGDEINHFIHPIVENFRQHFDPGVWISRTYKYPNGRHIRSAVVLESMDLIAARQWSGLGPPTHTYLCSCCWVTQDEIDKFSTIYKERTLSEHRVHVQEWRDATSSAQRKLVWKHHAARHSEMLAFPWWDPFITSTIAPMHWTRNILEKQLRENMGWSWDLKTGIPGPTQSAKPVSTLEVQWGTTAMQHLNAEEFLKSKLTAPIIRHLCNERGIFNVGLPSRRMLNDLNLWVRGISY